MLSRRRFLWSTSMISAATLLAACGAPPPAPSAPAISATTAPSEPAALSPRGFREAPMLAEKVAAGELPPIDERLPKDVLVIEPEAAIGQFGGKMRTLHAGDCSPEPGLLTRWHSDRSTFVPLVAKGYEWADDYTSITIFLREGMRWSDGEPYTADNILWWWNEVVQSDLNLQPYSVTGLNSQTDNLVKVDDNTIRFEFAEPRPRFLEQSWGGWSYGFYGHPFHYFEQFHPAHNGTPPAEASEVFEKLLVMLHQDRKRMNPDAPTINAWKVVEYKQGEYALFERNPYYYAVDTEGNQLPYLDHVESRDKLDSDAELQRAQALAGDTDLLFRVLRPADYPLFKEKEEELGVQVLTLVDTFNGKQAFQVNQDYTGDPAIAEMLRNVDFRRALSHGLDRELMNESIFLGLGQPGHGFSNPGEYHEEVDGAYATRDLERANALLDAVGLEGRDADNFRTLPDGSPLTITLLFRSGWGIGADEVVSIAVDNWQELGLRVNAKSGEARLYGELVNANDYQIRLQNGTGGWTGFWTSTLALRLFASEEWDWMESAQESERRGKEPQGALKELADLQWLAYQTLDNEEADAAYLKYREIMADQLFQFGTVGNVPVIMLINADLRNVPGQASPAAISQGEASTLRVDQWYFEQ